MSRAKHKKSFDYPSFRTFEKTIGPVEESLIRERFLAVEKGNDALQKRSSPERTEALWLFRHGWLCCRMELQEGS